MSGIDDDASGYDPRDTIETVDGGCMCSSCGRPGADEDGNCQFCEASDV